MNNKSDAPLGVWDFVVAAPCIALAPLTLAVWLLVFVANSFGFVEDVVDILDEWKPQWMRGVHDARNADLVQRTAFFLTRLNRLEFDISEIHRRTRRTDRVRAASNAASTRTKTMTIKLFPQLALGTALTAISFFSLPMSSASANGPVVQASGATFYRGLCELEVGVCEGLEPGQISSGQAALDISTALYAADLGLIDPGAATMEIRENVRRFWLDAGMDPQVSDAKLEVLSPTIQAVVADVALADLSVGLGVEIIHGEASESNENVSYSSGGTVKTTTSASFTIDLFFIKIEIGQTVETNEPLPGGGGSCDEGGEEGGEEGSDDTVNDGDLGECPTDPDEQ